MPKPGGGVHCGLMISRREFLASSAAVPLAVRALAEPLPPHPWLLLGTDTGKGIYRARWNGKTGEIGTPELAAASARPIYFARHPQLPILYAANELTAGKAHISAFRLAAGSLAADSLTPLHQTPCDDGPCFLSCDAASLNTANYSAGSFQTWSLAADGTPQTPPQAIRAAKFTHPGPVHDRQDNPHFHCAVFSPDARHILVCDLGSDRILVVRRSATAAFTSVATRPGSGPRHLAFHPNGKWLYCIHELDCTIDLFDWDTHGGKGELKLRENSVMSTLASGTPVGSGATRNTACEIVISPDGRFAYACTRFVDQITVYRIDAATGLLTEQQRVSAGGRIPRTIAFDPTRCWLVACNQGLASPAPLPANPTANPNPVGNLAVFAHDPATGRLDPTPQTFAAETPMCIEWL